MDDRSIHLLFSANRWEKAKDLGEVLAGGTNVVCDRYAYSGVAFTSAKRTTDEEGNEGGSLGLKWCMGPDVGLPAPDCVIFLELGQEEAEKRGGYVHFRVLLASFVFLLHVLFVFSVIAFCLRKCFLQRVIELCMWRSGTSDESGLVLLGEKPEIHVLTIKLLLPEEKMPFYCLIRLSYFAIETVTGQIS